MLHFFNKWSLGITDHDGETGILVSADLSKAFLKVKEKRQKLLRGN